MHTVQLEQLVQKLQSLPPQRVSEVENFIDSLRQHEKIASTQAALNAAETLLEEIWGNADDAHYDRL